MKRIIILGLIFGLSPIWANWTRMNTLMLGDYIDDPVNIDIYPQHIAVFENYFYGDILPKIPAYGLIFTPIPKHGGIGFWNHCSNFNLGYANTIKKIDFGIMGSVVKDLNRLGLGLGYSSFNRRIDLSIITDINKGFGINLRLIQRKSEFILVSRYSFHEEYDYQGHKIGVVLQRLILNDGFVFGGGEYILQNDETPAEWVYCYAGFELPLNRTFYLRMGVREIFDEDFIPRALSINPGIGLGIRDIDIDFHLDQGLIFDGKLPFFTTFGVNVNFGGF